MLMITLRLIVFSGAALFTVFTSGAAAQEAPSNLEKRPGGNLFQLNVSNGQGTTFGPLARGGFADSLYPGFNLARKFF